MNRRRSGGGGSQAKCQEAAMHMFSCTYVANFNTLKAAMNEIQWSDNLSLGIPVRARGR